MNGALQIKSLELLVRSQSVLHFHVGFEFGVGLFGMMFCCRELKFILGPITTTRRATAIVG